VDLLSLKLPLWAGSFNVNKRVSLQITHFNPSTKRITGLHMDDLVLWCDMFAPKGRLEWYHGLHVGLHLKEAGKDVSVAGGEINKILRGIDGPL
jgi:hypothetical protein